MTCGRLTTAAVYLSVGVVQLAAGLILVKSRFVLELSVPDFWTSVANLVIGGILGASASAWKNVRKDCQKHIVRRRLVLSVVLSGVILNSTTAALLTLSEGKALLSVHVDVEKDDITLASELIAYAYATSVCAPIVCVVVSIAFLSGFCFTNHRQEGELCFERKDTGRVTFKDIRRKLPDRRDSYLYNWVYESDTPSPAIKTTELKTNNTKYLQHMTGESALYRKYSGSATEVIKKIDGVSRTNRVSFDDPSSRNMPFRLPMDTCRLSTRDSNRWTCPKGMHAHSSRMVRGYLSDSMQLYKKRQRRLIRDHYIFRSNEENQNRMAGVGNNTEGFFPKQNASGMNQGNSFSFQTTAEIHVEPEVQDIDSSPDVDNESPVKRSQQSKEKYPRTSTLKSLKSVERYLQNVRNPRSETPNESETSRSNYVDIVTDYSMSKRPSVIGSEARPTSLSSMKASRISEINSEAADELEKVPPGLCRWSQSAVLDLDSNTSKYTDDIFHRRSESEIFENPHVEEFVKPSVDIEGEFELDAFDDSFDVPQSSVPLAGRVVPVRLNRGSANKYRSAKAIPVGIPVVPDINMSREKQGSTHKFKKFERKNLSSFHGSSGRHIHSRDSTSKSVKLKTPINDFSMASPAHTSGYFSAAEESMASTSNRRTSIVLFHDEEF